MILIILIMILIMKIIMIIIMSNYMCLKVPHLQASQKCRKAVNSSLAAVNGRYLTFDVQTTIDIYCSCYFLSSFSPEIIVMVSWT